MDERPGRVQDKNLLVSSVVFSKGHSKKEGWWGTHLGLSSRGLSVGPGYTQSPLAEELKVRGQVVGPIRSPSAQRDCIHLLDQDDIWVQNDSHD